MIKSIIDFYYKTKRKIKSKNHPKIFHTLFISLILIFSYLTYLNWHTTAFEGATTLTSSTIMTYILLWYFMYKES